MVRFLGSRTPSLDLIKLYNKRSAYLLNPTAGIVELSKQANKYFLKHDKQIRRLSRLNRNLLSEDKKKEISQNDINIFMYQTNKNDLYLQRYISDLIEITNRAIVGKQNYLAEQSLNQVSALVGSYLIIYEDLFTLKPVSFGVSTSDANECLSPIFESLKDLSKLCINNNDELAYKYVLRTLANITISIINIEARQKDAHFRSINWLSYGYLETCIIDAIDTGFSDAGLEGIGLINKMVSNAPSTINADKFFRQAIESHSKICMAYYKKADWLLAEYAINGFMVVLDQALIRDLNQRSYLWSAALRELKIIFAGAHIVSQAVNVTIINCPMKAAHSVTQTICLTRLLAKELEACHVNPDYPHSNPYYQFLNCSEKLYEYMRDIAKDYDLEENPILYDLIEMSENISDIFMYALENQLRPDRIDQEELRRRLESHNYFLSNVFYNKKNISHSYASKAAKILTKTGLRAYDSQIWGLPKSCRNLISNIAKFWNNSNSAPIDFDHLTDEFFECLWMFQKAAEIKNDTATINIVAGEIESLINVFSDEKGSIIRERLERIIESNNERINDGDDHMDLDGLISILKQMQNP